ncbi:MAG: RNA polymerase sigma factor [Roseimicrobium sp.]
MATPDPSPHKFPTTSWTLIQKVQQGPESEAQMAMEEICRAYWYPIYAFARRSGASPHDAEDLTQAMFQKLLTHEALQDARAEHGRLRSFFIAVLKQMIANQHRNAMAQKRGGGGAVLNIDDLQAEELYRAEPAGISDPEKLFDRAWAESVLQAAEAKLREDFVAYKNVEIFDALRMFLSVGKNETPQAALAKRLGMKPGTLRMQIRRMRQQYAAHIDSEIAQTVGGGESLESERDYLISLVNRS